LSLSHLYKYKLLNIKFERISFFNYISIQVVMQIIVN